MNQLLFEDKDTIDLVVSQASSYFINIPDSYELINSIADVVYSKNIKLLGTKFPVCIVIEALDKIIRINPNKHLISLNKDLKVHLEKGFTESHFNYFNNKYLPDDLDTAACLARVLKSNRTVICAYDNIVARNILPNDLISTWLDTEEHELWCSGNRIYHLDVMLNHWYTQAMLGRDLNIEHIFKTVRHLGLKNYWYIPSLYTSFLYSRLLSFLKLGDNSKYVNPLNEIINEYSCNREAYSASSNYCTFEKVKNSTLKLQNNDFNQILLHGIKRNTGKESFSNITPLFNIKNLRNTAFYWNLRFRTYRADPVTVSLSIEALV